MGTTCFTRSMAYRLASKAGQRRGEATTMATLTALGSTRPIRCTMETSRTSQRPSISVPISSSFLSAIGLYASYSRCSTEAPLSSSTLVVPTKVEMAPQSGLWAAEMRPPTSIASSTMANIPLTPRDRRQHRDLVTGRDAGVPAGVLAVNREGQGVAHGREIRVPFRQDGPELVEGGPLRRNHRFAGPRAVSRRPEEQHLHAIRVHAIGSGTYPGPTTTLRARGMTENSAGSSPMISPSAVNSRPGNWVSTRISFARAKNTPSLPR